MLAFAAMMMVVISRALSLSTTRRQLVIAYVFEMHAAFPSTPN
jgi:hypothetical protein